MGPAKDKLTFEKEVSNGWCVLVPAGTWHNITNIGATPMQVYAIYAPAHHKPGKVQATAVRHTGLMVPGDGRSEPFNLRPLRNDSGFGRRTGPGRLRRP
jgi:hypothetical protein